MELPSVRVNLILVFLVDTAAGTVLFGLFRWVADKNPPAESLQLGLIGAAGSLVYLLTCLLVSRLGSFLEGRKMPVLGIAISIVGLVLLSMNRSIWAMYLLWPMMLGSWALIFPSFTGWLRFGRSGKALRHVIFLFCIVWMSGITLGTFLGSRLYALNGPDIGIRYAYLVCIGIYIVSLLVLWVSVAKSRLKQEPIDEEVSPVEEVDSALAGAFMRVGWLGNILLMLYGAVLFTLFNKLATDMGIPPSAHGWLVVVFRGSALITVGLMVVSLFWHHHWWGYLLAQGAAFVGMCIVGVSEDYWLFVVGFVLCGIMLGHNYYAGVYYSLNNVSSGDALGQRGRAAMNESFFPVGAMVGAGLGGLAGLFWVRSPYFLAAGAAAVVFVIQLNTIRKARGSEHAVESSN